MRLPPHDVFSILPISLLRRTNVLPESPVQELFPSGICCRPPRRYTDQPGPEFGARFFFGVLGARQVQAARATAAGCGFVASAVEKPAITQMS